jgi:hypothetical protein
VDRGFILCARRLVNARAKGRARIKCISPDGTTNCREHSHIDQANNCSRNDGLRFDYFGATDVQRSVTSVRSGD